jgi:hypothetical protein
MLWPEKRDKDEVLGDKIPGKIDRTTQRSFLRIAQGYVPENLSGLLSTGNRWFPKFFGDGGVEIGPIPKGTPVGLLANLQLRSEEGGLSDAVDRDRRVVDLVVKIKHDLDALPKDASDADASRILENLVKPLMDLSKCPDYIVNRGHYFGTSKFAEEPGLSDEDKRALIEFLKTF